MYLQLHSLLMACTDSTNFIAFILVSFRGPVHLEMVGSTVLRFFCASPFSQDELNITKTTRVQKNVTPGK
jgi:hypothetical protein